MHNLIWSRELYVLLLSPSDIQAVTSDAKCSSAFFCGIHFSFKRCTNIAGRIRAQRITFPVRAVGVMGCRRSGFDRPRQARADPCALTQVIAL